MVDFSAGALSGGTVDVTRHLFDPCDTSLRATRPIWSIDSNKLDKTSGSSLDLVFRYTTAEVATAEEGALRVWTRPPGNPCGSWTPIPLVDTQGDPTTNRITATLTSVTSLGSFTLAPEAPDTSITGGPTGVTNDDTPTFTFTAAPPAASFECRLDSDRESDFVPCTSPFTTAPLANGPHRFEVRGRDAAGFADPTPASSGFSVGATPCQGALPTVVGTHGSDNLVGTAGADVILALGGDDQLSGLGGDDLLCGGAGDDRTLAGDGFDTASGGSGDDELLGEALKDILKGGGGADELSGSSGPDDLFGGDGDDTLDGGTGPDDCNGGSGTDSATTCETVTEVP